MTCLDSLTRQVDKKYSVCPESESVEVVTQPQQAQTKRHASLLTAPERAKNKKLDQLTFRNIYEKTSKAAQSRMVWRQR